MKWCKSKTFGLAALSRRYSKVKIHNGGDKPYNCVKRFTLIALY
jgi:hypothetical protein